MADLTGTLCRCWRLTCSDGRVFAFTDHDARLSFDGADFSPSDAMTARALEQTTGLSVDNSEAIGALSAAGLTEEDILAGRFDSAAVEIWQVNWSDLSDRRLSFRGTLGEIERAGGAFKAELRGLTEQLNRPVGRLYQKQCAARFGDATCGMNADIYAVDVVVSRIEGAMIEVTAGTAPAEHYAFGTLRVLDGAASGQVVHVRGDRAADGARSLTLWDSVRGLAIGDRVKLIAGCDKRAATCREKFGNMLNFRGFPHLPTEDWVTAYPSGGAS
ncbi:phage conserved hypothetical protein BR0599 [Palleronia marisminoris]|uniref:Bacteriophage phiJL001 Gp84 C-terminal domain-containing protein n=1 Tax=Palleronia marisminoris TaxID=315423 RepID=A0A1Y5RI08_9RHOB|nr:DUF2163 domain-containing protein [Palleronia marisminoris]SFG18542.1 phage conserved hypothetical protein BR0599 [Palleronia marisminoris]SLN16955.1 hypothetical protein PAM7066_00437 [Palleronia marisminoris]